MTPNQAYSDPSKGGARSAGDAGAGQAQRSASAHARCGDRVRVRVKPRENRGAYRVTETAWTEQTYQITGIEHTDMGPLFTLRGWQGGRLVARECARRWPRRGGRRWTPERPGTHEQPGKCAWLPDQWLRPKAAKNAPRLKKTKQSQPSAGKTLFFRGLHQCAMLIPNIVVHPFDLVLGLPALEAMGPLCHLLVGFRFRVYKL